MAQLLVSVRSAKEAEAALAGGADLIDVKEPARGSLGRADAATVDAVVRTVAGRRPVSAACGELLEERESLVRRGVNFVKWGLAGCATHFDWRARLQSHGRREPLSGSSIPTCVAVAYADYHRAVAPSPFEVVDFARSNGWRVFLIDTWLKDGATLLDWISVSQLIELRRVCHSSNVRVALAGSLGIGEIERLHCVEPDWFAVRGAACRAGQRVQEICSERVQSLLRSM